MHSKAPHRGPQGPLRASRNVSTTKPMLCFLR
nr:MAG TPA: hypothetical protein [Caudoviricetes sp.]